MSESVSRERLTAPAEHLESSWYPPVDEPVAGDRQQLPALLIVKRSRAVRKLQAARWHAHTCRPERQVRENR